MRLTDLDETLITVMVGPVPPEDFCSDGCTGILDTILMVDRRSACHWHDWSYTLGGCKADRLKADRRFYRNCRACGVWWVMAVVIYLGVRLFGGRHFAWRPA